MADVYTEGVCHDGAAILRNGERLTITEILAALNAATPPADAAKGEVPEGFTLVENKALSTARMALAHATTTHGELYRDAYESLLPASGRQDGAR